MSTQAVTSFAPADGAARWTKGLLVATLVLSVVGIISGLLQIELLSRAATGGISDAEAAANDSRQQLIGVLQVLLYLGTAVAFLMWFHRVHKNLPSLGGQDLKYTPGWAVGGFFVPFLNLVRPLQVMREVSHGSDPAGAERDRAPDGPSIRNQLGTPALVGWWWALLLISGFLGNVLMRMAFRQNPTLDNLRTISGLQVSADVIEIPSALIALVLVGRITRWQAQRLARTKTSELMTPEVLMPVGGPTQESVTQLKPSTADALRTSGPRQGFGLRGWLLAGLIPICGVLLSFMTGLVRLYWGVRAAWVFLLVSFLVPAALNVYLARKRGRSRAAWMLLGFLGSYPSTMLLLSLGRKQTPAHVELPSVHEVEPRAKEKAMPREQVRKKKELSVSAGLIITNIIAGLAVQIVLVVTGLSSVVTVIIAAVFTSVLVSAAWKAMGRSMEK